MNFKSFTMGSTGKSFICAIAILAHYSAFSQSSIAVAPSKMNVLYIGVDNPLAVAASNGTDDQVTVSVSGGEGNISKVSKGVYNIRVREVTEQCSVNVFVNGVLAGTSGFRVRNLPLPVATVAGLRTGSNIAAGNFRAQPGLGLHLKDFPFDVQYEVVSYTLTIGGEKDELKSAACKGALFSDEARQYINELAKPGSIVTIDAIIAKDPGGRELKLPALVYYIK